MNHVRFPVRHLVGVAMAMFVATSAHALVQGADTSQFSAVGEIGGASGVQIANNWVLTAAHVAQGVVANLTTFESIVGSSTVDAVYFVSNGEFPGNDLALLHLSTALDADLPMLNDTLITSKTASTYGAVTLATAQNAVLNGYGQSTVKSTMTVDYQNNTAYTVNWLITQGGAAVQGGDSGSAVFKGLVTDSGGATLLGIASATLGTTSSGAGISAYVQTAAYKTWINNTMASSGQQATWSGTATAVKAATSLVPEPGTYAMFMLAGVAALAHRPTRRRLIG